MVEIDAIIMAAGLSRRMGEQKLLLPFGSTTLLGYFLDHFPFALFREVFLVYSNQEVAEIGRGYGLKLVLNPDPEQGQGGSIKCGVEQSQAKDGMLFTVADQPFLGDEIITSVTQAFSLAPHKIIRPQYGGRPQNPVLFPQFCKDDLGNLMGDNGGRAVIAKYPEAVQLLNFTEELSFKDADYKEDYRFLLEELEKQHHRAR